MKTIPIALKNHFAGEMLTIATCFRIRWTDGTVFGFTNHTRDLVFNYETYKAVAGYKQTTAETGARMEVTNIELTSIMDSLNIREEDVRAGKWDYASVEMFQVNYMDLTQGRKFITSGIVGQISTGQTFLKAELMGMGQRLQYDILELTSVSCRATFGDHRCKKDLIPLTVTGTITHVMGDLLMLDTARTEANHYFRHGVLTWSGGDNLGYHIEVKQYLQTNGQIEIVLPMPHPVQVGDTYIMVPGCDKSKENCIVWDNIENMRAEPYMEGLAKMLQTAG